MSKFWGTWYKYIYYVCYCFSEEKETDDREESEAVVCDMLAGALEELDLSNAGVMPHECFREVRLMHTLVHYLFSCILI